MKYEINKRVLIIQSTVAIHELEFLRSLLIQYLIKEVNLESEVSPGCLFIIKKYTNTDVSTWSSKMALTFQSLKLAIPSKPGPPSSSKVTWLKQVLLIFSLKSNDKMQNKYWLKVFLYLTNVVIVDNIIMIILLFIGIGMAVSFLLYSEFLKYGIQMESCKVAIYAGVKILCPMFTSFAIMAKSCTALATVINRMYINGDPRILSLMNLPYNQVYLNPLFFTLLISGPIMNIISIYALLFGSCFTWVINDNSWRMFISIMIEEFAPEYLIDSAVRSGLCSLIYALGTCIGGITGYYSFNSAVRAINTCVFISTMGNVLVQVLVTIFTI